MNHNPLLLGIDLGTSSAKALLVDLDGCVIGNGSAEYPIHHPQPDHAEQAPEEWWAAVTAAVRQAVSAEHAPRVAAIGISGQMHGTLLLGKTNATAELQPLHPAVIWPDQRSRRQVQEITQLVGAERLIEIAGSPLATGFMAATLRWFQQERPELWTQVHSVLLPKDYLRWRFTGELASDPSDGAGALLLDEQTRDWSVRLLAALDIPRGLLPHIQSSITVAGGLCAAAAQELQLVAGTPVVTGAADTACSMLGAGAVDSDTLIVNLSTGGQLVLPANQPSVDRRGRIHTFCGALEPGTNRAGWYLMGATLSAGMSLRWLRDNVLGWHGPDAYERMTTLAAQVQPGADGLVFLPYLVGERTPHMNPSARGLFFGLTVQHNQAHLVRAVQEGVVFACYDAYCALLDVTAPPQQVILAGGGARSPLWQQIVSDVFGRPVQRLLVTEQSARGAALLAGAGLGLFDPVDTARRWTQLDDPILPDGQRSVDYTYDLVRFRAAYQALAGLF
jgi:xylulokinase